MDTNLHRRIQDDIVSRNPTHKMNLERRLNNNERRGKTYFAHIYNGPARRLIIDRRLRTDDRRIAAEEEFIY